MNFTDISVVVFFFLFTFSGLVINFVRVEKPEY